MDLLALRPVTLTWLRRQARARAGTSRGRGSPVFWVVPSHPAPQLFQLFGVRGSFHYIAESFDF